MIKQLSADVLFLYAFNLMKIFHMNKELKMM